MSMKEYQTFTYIMYQENLEREKREEEERRADEERKRSEEKQNNANKNNKPRTRAEMIDAARAKQYNGGNYNVDSPALDVIKPPNSATVQDIVDYLEDEF